MPRGQNPSLEIFLQYLFPWTPEHAQLWKSVTWTFFKDGEKRFANYAAQDYDGLMRLIETRAGRSDADVYVATGTQRVCSIDKYSADGFPKAERKIPNVVSHNSIYVDLDVKEGAYATTDDAFAALDDFIDKIGLPEATMEVLSGSGGLHAYWCTTEPMPIQSWIPLSKGLHDAGIAYGLKFDPQVTVNPAGILRAPSTRNWKTRPPGVVRLMEDSSFARYDYQQLVSALGQYVGPLTGIRQNQPMPVNSTVQNFTAGVGTAAPVALADVAAVCGVVDDILTRGGNGDAEPLWNLALLLASFTDDPHAAAHSMSNKDQRYSVSSTDKKLLEKVNARAANSNIGWPACSSFSALHPACATCPLFAHGKSPLAFARKPPPAQMVQAAATSPDPLMPFGYWRDNDKHVFTTISDKEKNSMTVDVLNRPILDAAIDGDSGSLVFRTRISGVEKWGSANVHSNLQPTPSAQAMAANGVYIKPEGYKTARDFLVSWMGHLQNIKRVIMPVSYGWTDDGKGFTFDQTVYMPTGKDLVFRGNSHDKRYAAKGDLRPWQVAMDLVYGNAPLEVVVASAFAAPLIELIGSSSVVLSVHSSLSGIGKTTSMMLAQAVWGDPRAGMSALADTTNSVMKKVADLKNLPIYWDELRTNDQLEKVIDLVFQITQGKAKSRLNKDITQAAAPSFTTMFVVASNYGISDTVYANTDGTEAGGLRVFEIEAEAIRNSMFADWQARDRLKPIEHNYGNAGAAYSDFIARNRDAIKKALMDTSKALDDRNMLSTKERFWNMTMASLLVGAATANAAGLTKFDLGAIDNFLNDTLGKLRHVLKVQEYTTLSGNDAGESVLSDIMSSIRGKHLLITDTIYYGTGRPRMVDASETGDITRLGEVWMQYGSKDGRVRMRVKPFNKWLMERRLKPQQIMRLLERHYYVTLSRAAIGMGVPYLDAISRQRTECYDLTPKNPPSGSSPGSS